MIGRESGFSIPNWRDCGPSPGRKRIDLSTAEGEMKPIIPTILSPTEVGIGYTLATGRLFCDWAVFQEWAEQLLDRRILTHEFADDAVWKELRDSFESRMEAISGEEAD